VTFSIHLAVRCELELQGRFRYFASDILQLTLNIFKEMNHCFEIKMMANLLYAKIKSWHVFLVKELLNE